MRAREVQGVLVFPGVERGYDWLLRLSLRHRAAVLILAVAVGASTFWIYPYLGEESFADDDQSEFEIVIQAPRAPRWNGRIGSSGRSSKRSLLFAASRCSSPPSGWASGQQCPTPACTWGLRPLREGTEFERILQHLGIRKLLGLPPLRERTFSQNDVMQDARKVMAKYPELTASVQNLFRHRADRLAAPSLQSGAARTGPRRLGPYSRELVTKARACAASSTWRRVWSAVSLRFASHIDRDKAADLGVGVDNIATSLRTMVGGEEVTKYKEADDQYPVRLRLQEDFRKDAEVISQLYVSSSRKGLIPLTNVVRISEEKGPNRIDRLDRERQVGIFANLDPKLTIGDAVKSHGPKIVAAKLPQGYTTRYLGRHSFLAEARVNFPDGARSQPHLHLHGPGRQFESFVHPFTIMASLPLALPFGLLSLLATGFTMNIYSASDLDALRCRQEERHSPS